MLLPLPEIEAAAVGAPVRVHTALETEREMAEGRERPKESGWLRPAVKGLGSSQEPALEGTALPTVESGLAAALQKAHNSAPSVTVSVAPATMTGVRGEAEEGRTGPLPGFREEALRREPCCSRESASSGDHCCAATADKKLPS